jgi:hypothetical protein
MENKINKVFITKKGTHKSYKVDLQYDNNIPYAVLEWVKTPVGEVPSIRIPLNPLYLEESDAIPDEIDYVYSRPVSWPATSI